jgi:hypothetical protein
VKNAEGNTPLHWACCNGKQEVMLPHSTTEVLVVLHAVVPYLYCRTSITPAHSVVFSSWLVLLSTITYGRVSFNVHLRVGGNALFNCTCCNSKREVTLAEISQ